MSIFSKIVEVFSDEIILILSEPLNKNSNILNIQNYDYNGISFIPIFTSEERLKESLNGHKLENEVIKIKGSYFCSLLLGNENITINPDLSDEIRTSATEIKDLMKEQIIKEIEAVEKKKER